MYNNYVASANKDNYSLDLYDERGGYFYKVFREGNLCFEGAGYHTDPIFEGLTAKDSAETALNEYVKWIS